jgi:peptidyl-prolyl cis-trans isomerase D
MLNFLRKTASTWVVKLLLGLLVVAFASWGIADVFTNVGSRGVASVGDTEVTQAEYAQAFDNELRARSQNGTVVSREDAIAAGLNDQVLSRLVYQVALVKAAEDAGVSISNATVARTIRDLPTFKNGLGFDRLSFQRLLSTLNLTEKELTTMIRDDKARGIILDAITGPITVPETMVNLYYGYQTETRAADFFQIDSAALEVTAPTDDELMAYYNANQNQFMAPEYRKFTAINIDRADLEKTIQVTDDELQKAYDDAGDKYAVPEKRTLSQIVVDSEEQAKKLYDEIKAGMDFDAVAKEAGKTEEDTKLGDMSLKDLEAVNLDVAARAFGLTEPGVTEPVKSPFGWHIVRVTSIQAASTRPLDEVKDELKTSIVNDRVVDAIFDLSNQVQDALASGSTLEDVAMEFSLPLSTPPLMDQSGFAQDGTRITDAPRGSIIRMAFATDPGAYPEVTEDGDNYAVVRVDNVVPAAVRPFEDVKDKARQAMLDIRHREAAEKLADTLKARAEGGETLEALATEAKAVFRQQEAIGRNGANAPAIFGNETMQALFQAPKDGVASAVGSDGQDYVVLKVTKVERKDPSQDPAGKTQLDGILKEVLFNQILEEYRQALYEKYDVRVYPTMAASAINANAQ